MVKRIKNVFVAHTIWFTIPLLIISAVISWKNRVLGIMALPAILIVGTIIWDGFLEKWVKRAFLKWLDRQAEKNEAVFIDPTKE